MILTTNIAVGTQTGAQNGASMTATALWNMFVVWKAAPRPSDSQIRKGRSPSKNAPQLIPVPNPTWMEMEDASDPRTPNHSAPAPPPHSLTTWHQIQPATNQPRANPLREICVQRSRRGYFKRLVETGNGEWKREAMSVNYGLHSAKGECKKV